MVLFWKHRYLIRQEENYPLTKAQILKRQKILLRSAIREKRKQIAEELLDLAEAERLPEL